MLHNFHWVGEMSAYLRIWIFRTPIWSSIWTFRYRTFRWIEFNYEIFYGIISVNCPWNVIIVNNVSCSHNQGSSSLLRYFLLHWGRPLAVTVTFLYRYLHRCQLFPVDLTEGYLTVFVALFSLRHSFWNFIFEFWAVKLKFEISNPRSRMRLFCLLLRPSDSKRLVNSQYAEGARDVHKIVITMILPPLEGSGPISPVLQ